MDNAVTTPGDAAAARTVDGARGVAWWSEAWALFVKNAGIWIVFGLILIVILIVLAFIPIVGFLATTLLLPVLAGGWLMAAHKLDGGGTIEVGDLFAAFKGDKLTPLLIVGAIFLAMAVVIGVVMGVLGLGGMMGLMAGGARRSAGGMMAGFGVGLFAVAVGMLLGLLATMAIWFATPLVVLRGMAPVAAVQTSFAACLKNIVPFLLWGVIYLGAAIVASIPFGLGWVVLGPLLMLTVYTSYRDVFGAPA